MGRRANRKDFARLPEHSELHLSAITYPLFGLSSSNRVARIMVMVFLPIFCAVSGLRSNRRIRRDDRENGGSRSECRSCRKIGEDLARRRIWHQIRQKHKGPHQTVKRISGSVAGVFPADMRFLFSPFFEEPPPRWRSGCE